MSHTDVLNSLHRHLQREVAKIEDSIGSFKRLEAECERDAELRKANGAPWVTPREMIADLQKRRVQFCVWADSLNLYLAETGENQKQSI